MIILKIIQKYYNFKNYTRNVIILKIIQSTLILKITQKI
jgi:hypothetical protein